MPNPPDSSMGQTQFSYPVSTASAFDNKYISQAPTIFVDTAPESAAAAGSIAAAAAFAATDELVAPTATRNAQHLRDSDKEATWSDAPRGISPFPDLGARVANEQEDASKNKRRLCLILGGVVVLVIIAAAVAVPVAITQAEKSSSGSSSASSSTGPDNTGSGQNDNPTSSGPTGAVTGGDGTVITTDKGTTFTYVNKLGGTWYDDPKDPYNNNARAQSTSPPLSQEWDYQNDPMRGVNLGGWFVPEPFIVPALFEPYLNATPPAQDEWTLSLAMAADTANGGLDQLEKHYDTFITEQDFAEIAGAGLNWIRLPIPYWAIEKYPDEPFLEKVAWKYVLKAFKWARKYGLRINLDLHTIPGSQNGYNHSGKGGAGGQVNFLYGPMGLANAQRALDYIRIITEFISQPEYAPVVPMFGIINEVLAATVGVEQTTSFYLQVHDTMREITGRGQGKGPFISIHDSFRGLAAWKDLLPGHDRIALDTHSYLIFVNVDRSSLTEQIQKPCQSWAADMNNSWTDFGVSIAGEFSLAINDCGQWINGVGAGTRWEGTFGTGDGTAGDCTDWNDWQSWTQQRKDDFRAFALRNFDALGHWFFYTWKIGESSITGKVETPMWSYKLGLEKGWIPADPSEAVGTCGNTSPATPLRPEMYGAAGTGEISAAVKAKFPWPPTTINPGLRPDNVRTYTATGAIPTLPVPTGASPTVDGWFDAADTRPIYTPIAGCTYPDAWGSATGSNPGPCNGFGSGDNVRESARSYGLVV
ncbi:hypothetical protein FS837_001448 [Tulasnella sp. UAMH 9824]|nr:hypothetical protein FS837_001448 [Tulasnella sp. UAMH 9824]